MKNKEELHCYSNKQRTKRNYADKSFINILIKFSKTGTFMLRPLRSLSQFILMFEEKKMFLYPL